MPGADAWKVSSDMRTATHRVHPRPQAEDFRGALSVVVTHAKGGNGNGAVGGTKPAMAGTH